MSEAIARVHVSGRGLYVVDATEAAEAVTQRPLVGMPLSESMWEDVYDGVLASIRRAVVEGIATSEVVCAPDGTVGRIVADPTNGGACVTFVPVGFAIHEVYGPDLICGIGNAEFQRRAGGRWSEGIAAREAFSDPRWEYAQDALSQVMRNGITQVISVAETRMAITRPRPGVVRTAAR